MMGKREMELPAIHKTNRFRGSCFHGPRAIDQPIYRNNRIVEMTVVVEKLVFGLITLLLWPQEMDHPILLNPTDKEIQPM